MKIDKEKAPGQDDAARGLESALVSYGMEPSAAAAISLLARRGRAHDELVRVAESLPALFDELTAESGRSTSRGATDWGRVNEIMCAATAALRLVREVGS